MLRLIIAIALAIILVRLVGEMLDIILALIVWLYYKIQDWF